MREIRTSGLMSGERKRSDAHRAQATAPLLDSTIATCSRPSGSTPPPPSRCLRSRRPAIRIPVVADNARDHHARLVRHWLKRADCRIKLVFLPAYALHLNVIERLWGVMHREAPHSKFHARFAVFVEAIFDFFRRRLPQEWTTWLDTVTDTFQIISRKEVRDLG